VWFVLPDNKPGKYCRKRYQPSDNAVSTGNSGKEAMLLKLFKIDLKPDKAGKVSVGKFLYKDSPLPPKERSVTSVL